MGLFVDRQYLFRSFVKMTTSGAVSENMTFPFPWPESSYIDHNGPCVRYCVVYKTRSSNVQLNWVAIVPNSEHYQHRPDSQLDFMRIAK